MNKKNTLFYTFFIIGYSLIPTSCSKTGEVKDDDTKYSGALFTENIRSTDPRTPEEELAGLKVPEGFEITLFASEPNIDKPINLAFDAKGRLWVTSSFEYPFPSTQTPKGTDRITILEDTDHDGKADKFTDVSDTVNIPIGILPLNDQAVTFSIPSVYKYTDSNNDGILDHEQVLYGRFGYQDTHGMVSNFMRGYDGWVHACHGFTNRSTVAGTDGDSIRMVSGNTFRFRLDGSRVEQLTFGQVNPFGLVFDSLGYVYSTDSHSSPLYQLIRGADYPHFGKVEIMAFAPDMKSLENEATALCGITQYADTVWPKEFQGNFFIGDVVNCRVHRYSSVWKGSSPAGKSEIDFIKSEDPWFRPVNIKIGPDGAMYVADFYNAIIGHYEVPLGHPKRDKQRGRIWRITYKGQQNKVKDLSVAPLDELLAATDVNNLPTRMTAADQIADRIGADAIPSLKAILEDKASSPRKYIHAQWLLYRLNAVTDDILKKSLTHASSLVRVHTLRVLVEKKPDANFYPLIVNALEDNDPHVQRVATELMMKYPTIASVESVLALQHSLPESDNHLVYTARLALRNLLRNDALLKEVVTKEWSPADAGSMAFVMIDVPSAPAAEFMAKYLESNQLVTQKIPVAYKHITRFIPEAKLNGVISAAMKKNENNIDLKALIFKGIVEGMQQRGGKGNSPQFAQWGTEVANGLMKKYPPGVLITSQQKLEGLSKENADELRNQEIAEKLAQQRFAIQLAGDYKITALQPSLKSYLEARTSAVDIRTSALRSLLKIDAVKNMELAGQILTSDSSTLDLRKRIITVTGEFQGPALNKVLAQVKNAPSDLQIAVVTALSSSPEGRDIVFQQVRKGELASRTLLDPKVQERILMNISTKQQKEYESLTANLDPIDGERQALIEARLKAFKAVDVAAIPIDSGQNVFGRNCAICHRRVSSSGTGIGPQLHGIGSRGAESLAEKILDPNRNISEAFRSYTIKLKDGKVLTGLFRREEGAVIVFADFAGKEFSVPKKDIVEQKASKFSVMPDNFGTSLTQDEFNALLAYLLNS
jgi:putative heme-binding domain-containing protein